MPQITLDLSDDLARILPGLAAVNAVSLEFYADLCLCVGVGLADQLRFQGGTWPQVAEQLLERARQAAQAAGMQSVEIKVAPQVGPWPTPKQPLH
jgi:hypothetical protein